MRECDVKILKIMYKDFYKRVKRVGYVMNRDNERLVLKKVAKVFRKKAGINYGWKEVWETVKGSKN